MDDVNKIIQLFKSNQIDLAIQLIKGQDLNLSLFPKCIIVSEHNYKFSEFDKYNLPMTIKLKPDDINNKNNGQFPLQCPLVIAFSKKHIKIGSAKFVQATLSGSLTVDRKTTGGKLTLKIEEWETKTLLTNNS